MEITFNPLTNKFDITGMTEDELAQFVKIAGDTMTGTLVITPTTDENAIEIASGKWVVLDA